VWKVRPEIWVRKIFDFDIASHTAVGGDGEGDPRGRACKLWLCLLLFPSNSGSRATC
jgi:hypothetical protein